MDLKEVKKVVSGIKGTLFKNSNSYSMAMLKSHFKGHGLKFKEHQIYQFGDDVRFIDWKIFAKTNKAYIKTFEEERNVCISVLIDSRESMFMGHDNISKIQASIELTCLILLLAEQTKDKVRIHILEEKGHLLPETSGEKGIYYLLSFLRRLNILNSDGKINYNFPSNKDFPHFNLRELTAPYIRKRQEVVIFSDLSELVNFSDFEKIIKRKNVHCFQILSPLDEDHKIPYSLYLKNNNGAQFINLKMKKKLDQKKIYGKRVRFIKVHERYLEKFVKDML